MVLGLYMFNTAIGDCALAWSERGVAGCALPENTSQDTLARLTRRWPCAERIDPPSLIRAAAETICALIRGEEVDLTGIALDQTGHSELELKVWAITQAIPYGKTLTYGEIARQLGDIGLSRAVGRALAANPIPILVPCHRVVASEGKSGGFSAPGGVLTKLRLLNIERAVVAGDPMLFADLPLAIKAH